MSDSVGIIYPPPDVRAIVDKTAQFVARNGRTFEHKIRSREMNNLKFGFLSEDDPYHAYYESKIAGFKAENDKTPEQRQLEAAAKAQAEAAAKQREAEEAAAKQKREAEEKAGADKGDGVLRKSAATNSALALAAKASDVSKPPPSERFIIAHPGLAAVDADVMKLTAQYTAVSGRQFLSKLAQREAGNPQFDFLKPTHMMFQYFTKLSDAYAKCLNPTKADQDALAGLLERRAQGRMNVLERAVHRLQFEHAEKAKRDAANAEEEAERVAYQSIDWHDFVVVETIELDDDEEEAPGAGEGDAGAMDMDVSMDMDVDVDMSSSSTSTSSAGAAVPPPGKKSRIVVQESYEPRVGGAKSKESGGVKYFVDPRTGKNIPIEGSEQHMRYDLLDPRWLVERERALQKRKLTSYATGEQIAANLASLAPHRTDIFGGDEKSAQKAVEDKKAAAAKRAKEAVVWDGDQSTVGATQKEAVRNLTAAANASLPPALRQPPPLRSAARATLPAPPTRVPMPPTNPFPGRGPPPPPPPPPPRQPAAMPMSMAPRGMPPGGMPPPQPPPPQPPRPRGPVSAPPAPAQAVVPAPPPAPAPAGPQKLATGRLSEADWIATHSGPVTINVAVPQEAGSAYMLGQTIALKVTAGDKMAVLKQQLAEKLGGSSVVKWKKIQLKMPSLGFLKDNLSLAYYNIEGGGTMEMKMKTRSRGKR